MATLREKLEATIAELKAELEAIPPDPPQNPNARPVLMTAAEYAAHLRISRRTLRRLIDDGLPILRPRPKLIRVVVADAAAWMARRERSARVSATKGSIQ